MSYKHIWHNYEIEHPTDEKDYLVFVVADDDYGNVDYIDVCFWNGEYFEGGGKTGIDDGLGPAYWMELPEFPASKAKSDDTQLGEEELKAMYAVIVSLQELADTIAEMFAPFFEQTLKLLDDNQIENEENIGDI